MDITALVEDMPVVMEVDLMPNSTFHIIILHNLAINHLFNMDQTNHGFITEICKYKNISI
jgi:hypothetical protein